MSGIKEAQTKPARAADVEADPVDPAFLQMLSIGDQGQATRPALAAVPASAQEGPGLRAVPTPPTLPAAGGQGGEQEKSQAQAQAETQAKRQAETQAETQAKRQATAQLPRLGVPAATAAGQSRLAARGLGRIGRPVLLNARIPPASASAWESCVEELNRDGARTTKAELLCAWLGNYTGENWEADQLLAGRAPLDLPRYELVRANPEIEASEKGKLERWRSARRAAGQSGTISELVVAVIEAHAGQASETRALLARWRGAGEEPGS